MKSIINCESISKSYGKQNVIKDFSYSFTNNKLYAVYGESGCGKTTLLNLLYGLLKTDNGKIYLYGNDITKLKRQTINENIAYVSQNNYFVDYLNIYDNLKLNIDKDKISEIDKKLKEFNLYDKKYSYSYELSGGEQERMAIICSILQNKKIILLDEPTSSLDKTNRKKLLDLLQKLKKDQLIICATHDLDLIKIADEKIDFLNLKETKASKNEIVKEEIKPINKNRNHLFPFMMKQFLHKKNEKFSSIVLVIIFTIIISVFNLCCKYEDKLTQSLISYYDINFVNYRCDVKNSDYCDSIIKKHKGIKNVFLYEDNLPERKCYDETGTCDAVDYVITARILPLEKELFPNIDKYIVEGTYYQDELDILIGIEKASKLTNNIEDLIGTTYTVKLPDKEEKFRIAGILNFDDSMYMKTMELEEYINNDIFLNDEYVSKYRYDDIIGYGEESGYAVMRAYFSNPRDLYKFYKNNRKNAQDNITYKSEEGIIIEPYSGNFIDFMWLIKSLEYFLLPAVSIGFIIAIIFFYQTERLKNNYRSHILSVYNLYGYKWSTIIINNILVNIINITIIFLIAFICSILLIPLLNLIFINLNIVKFNLFSLELPSSRKLLKTLICLSFIFSFISSIKPIKKGWVQSLKEGEDYL